MDLSWIITALLLLIVGVLITYAVYMSSEHGIFKQLGIPALSPLPVVGNFFQELKLGPFKFQEEQYKKFKAEKVYGYYSCKTPVLVIRDLDMIRDIMVKHFGSFVNRRVFQLNEPYTHMLTMIKDDHWKNVRTTVSPTFSTGKLRRMFHHISSSARTLVEHLREKKDRDQAVELKHVASSFTMDVIASTGFGVEVNSLKEERNEFVVKAKKVMDAMGRMVMFTFFFPFMTGKWDMVGINILPKDATRFFRTFIDETLKTRREFTEPPPSMTQVVSHGLSKRNDFLQLLVESEREDNTDNDNMSKDEARELKMSTERKPLSHTDIQVCNVPLRQIFSPPLATVLKMDTNSGIQISHRTDEGIFNLQRLHAKTQVISPLVHDMLYVDDCAIIACEHDLYQLKDPPSAATKRCVLNFFTVVKSASSLEIYEEGQAIIFLLAGYDTVSSVMSFTLFLLAENPDCCAKLQQEIDDKLGKRLPTYDNMQDMPYMDMCLNESMRMYPPGFQFDRICNEDVVIGGVLIPKGMTVAFPMFSIHRDSTIWDDPMTFDPERFAPENRAKRHPYAHLPFGQGPRNCIGMRLALLEIKVALSAVLQEMNPVVCSETTLPIRLKYFIMTAKDGLWIKMVDRGGK
ncbi:cytochrome P450 3A11 [Elysia marginata]|uniref:Cytochrome P450 3A11 n=1 Tax=Elysia marginata TaxID=1093978 RepID=A0AAV4GXJ0_9GAST|nr:cytochrome P450 3A11 [Elysia marginata]